MLDIIYNSNYIARKSENLHKYLVREKLYRKHMFCVIKIDFM